MLDVVSYGAGIATHGRLREWQQGLGLLKELSQRGVQTNKIIYNSSISGCSTRDGWQQGAETLQKMRHLYLERDVVSMCAVMTCQKIGDWQNGIFTLQNMRMLQIRSNVVSCSTASTLCAQGHQWQQSLMSEMQACQIETNTIMCNSALMVFEQPAWHSALHEFCHFQTACIQVNSRTYGIAATAAQQSSRWPDAIAMLSMSPVNVQLLTTAISAWEQGGHWQQALRLLNQVVKASQVDIVAYNSAISACAKSGKWQMSLDLLVQLTEMSLKGDDITFNAVMNALAQGSHWKRSLILLRDLDGRGQADLITFSTAMAACDKSSQWRACMQLFEEVRGKKQHQNNEIIYNTAIHACQLGQQWFLALELLHTMESRIGPPSIVSWDSAMLACLGCRDDLALEVFLKSASLRDPVSFMWGLASLGVSDAHVIHDAAKDVIENWSSSLSATDLARCWWSAAMLGIQGEWLKVSDVQPDGQLWKQISSNLDDLNMALTGLVMSPKLSLMLDAQASVEQLLRRRDLHELRFDRQGKDLLAILFSCAMAGCLSLRLRRVAQILMRQVGFLLDKGNRVDLRTTGLEGHLLASSKGDRCVLVKPAGWEVYGGHVNHQLIDLVKQSMPSPIFFDAQHNFGFLHRLDVPSSGLILIARNYEAFYDLQVQLHNGQISREYTVLSHGTVPESRKKVCSSTQIRNDLPTISGGRGRFSKTLLAVSRYIQCRVGSFSLLLIRILTGRKHQIRSHLAHIGHPTVRDKMYTSRATFESDRHLCARNWLHRHRISFADEGGTTCEASCDLPADLSAVFAVPTLRLWKT